MDIILLYGVTAVSMKSSPSGKMPKLAENFKFISNYSVTKYQLLQ
jgi:hypothetical protein